MGTAGIHSGVQVHTGRLGCCKLFYFSCVGDQRMPAANVGP
jgi:hypothetical protein